MTTLPLILILVYSLTLWMGAYALRRAWHKPAVRFAGAGLVAYALGLALSALASSPDVPRLASVIPALCWLASVVLFHRQPTGDHAPRHPAVLIIIATLFFTMSVALLFIPQTLLANDALLLMMSIDLLILGYAVARYDAYDAGEALLPDALRSLGLTLLGVIVFGGQVVAAMLIDGASPALMLLLFGVVTSAILLPFLAPSLQAAADSLVFASTPQIVAERAELQAAYNALSRRDDSLDVLALDEQEFARLTRRALSYLSDVERLAASPLIHLPAVTARLTASSRADSTLNRTSELRALLVESIARLKPDDGHDFGTTEAWRYYNALYFPYVIGLKPYRIEMNDTQDAASQAVGAWFREQVPERTLHNWQNRAAQVIARDLRETAAQTGSNWQ